MEGRALSLPITLNLGNLVSSKLNLNSELCG